VNRLTHARVWSALDALARRYSLSASGLAKRAGLDPTSFNKSKRVTGEGRPRWPTTESIAKVLEATGATFEDFTQLVTAAARGARGRAQPIPLIGLTQAGAGGFFDDGGFPVGQGWDQIRFPKVDDENAYALEVTGDSMQPRPRGAAHDRWRGDGQDPDAAHGQDGRARLLQPGPPQSRLPRGPHRLDGAHRVGQPVAESPNQEASNRKPRP
jgi:hypothetical protein